MVVSFHILYVPLPITSPVSACRHTLPTQQPNRLHMCSGAARAVNAMALPAVTHSVGSGGGPTAPKVGRYERVHIVLCG